jgi:uncharacterized RDD family membrane protein YckC
VLSTDQLHIDTPEQVALELPLAGVGSRFLAIAVDTILQAVVFAALGLLVALAPAGLGAGWMARAFGTFAPAAIVFFVFCVYWGYFAVFEAVWAGQTPGKRYAGIRVIKDSGRPINAFEAVARNLMRAIDGLPVLYGVALVVMVLSREHRRLGDYVAGTVVVHEHATEEVRPDSETGRNPVDAAPNALQVTPEELLLVETYLHRRFDLDPGVRMKTAVDIATRIRQRTGLEVSPGQTPDDFLEAVAQRTRDGARFR